MKKMSLKRILLESRGPNYDLILREINDWGSRLYNWNLKYDELPNIKAIVQKIMGNLPGGQKEAVEYLASVAQIRTDAFHGVGDRFQNHQRATEAKNKLIQVFDSLGGKKTVAPPHHEDLEERDRQNREAEAHYPQEVWQQTQMDEFDF